jgi:hypothetical protein
MTVSGSLAVTLSLADPSFFAIPYYFAIFAVLIVLLVLLVARPSLRKYTKKRNIALYFVFILILGSLFFQIDNVSRRALVSYEMDWKYNKAYSESVNEVVWSCSNYHGSRSADFYLVVSGVNVSFVVQNQDDYVLLSSTVVKVPFSIWGNSENKSIFYTVNSNVTRFSFSSSIENRGWGGIDVSLGMASVTFVWNATDNCYALTSASVFQ